MTALALFVSQLVLVFFLGLQSLSVNQGRRTAAFLTSFGIGICSLIAYRIAPNADGAEIIAFLLGGPIGIVASMHFHKRLMKGRTK